MKYIEVDEELYRHIASKTERIGESASDILRRLLGLSVVVVDSPQPLAISHPSLETEPVHQLVTYAVNDFSRLVNEHLLSKQKGAVGRFLFLLESLYQLAPEQFSQILLIQGRDRLYFARSREQLLEVSASANPKEIGTSGFWVTSNNSTAKKRTILSEVLVQFGCDAEVAASIAERV